MEDMPLCACPWCGERAVIGYVSVCEGAPCCQKHGVREDSGAKTTSKTAEKEAGKRKQS